MSLTPEDRAMKAREARRIHHQIEHREQKIRDAQQELAVLKARYEALVTELMGGEPDSTEEAS
ncbi:hypothetical protein [Streptomyces hydrogenans]|uniref:Uncharacterized protein n=1 Tax=Streptomyces hydrogenans TaxID=1873719 RepID=A0ABQ3PJK9_9ACTN|nr:hypothetical protein [Streptomyces hydrogenans]GHG10006.1 hypothetical protein GCM10018784_23340 [Streptomyces hydrogenans]GHI25214.1 hypothetical protein Shyd_65850 [Streptomyces hydrogenans]